MTDTTEPRPPGAWRAGDLLSAKQVAEWLGTNENRLAQWRHRGQGPRWVKLSPKMVRYLREDVEAFLEHHTRHSTISTPDLAMEQLQLFTEGEDR